MPHCHYLESTCIPIVFLFCRENIHIIAVCCIAKKLNTLGSTALDFNGSAWGVVSSMLRVVVLRKALDVLQLFVVLFPISHRLTGKMFQFWKCLHEHGGEFNEVDWYDGNLVCEKENLWAFNKTSWCSKTSMILLLAGERQHGFQIWLNVPKVHKADDPMCHDRKDIGWLRTPRMP